MGYPPTNLYEYQNKGITKIAIRKWLILKDAILVVGGLAKVEMAAWKKQSGSKLPHSKRSYLRSHHDARKIRRRAHADAHPHRRIGQVARQIAPRSHRRDAAQRRLLRRNRAARRRRLRRLKHLSHRQA